MPEGEGFAGKRRAMAIRGFWNPPCVVSCSYWVRLGQKSVITLTTASDNW